MPRTTTEPINAAKWDAMFFELETFQKEHGHCRVPQSHAELGKWTKLQRKKYKQQKIPQDRVERLNQLGFLWTVTAASDNVETATTTTATTPRTFVPGLQKEGLWQEKYQQLEAVCKEIAEVSSAVSAAAMKQPNPQNQNQVPEEQDDDRKPAAVDTSSVVAAAASGDSLAASSNQNSKAAGRSVSVSSSAPPSFSSTFNLWTTLKDQHASLYKWLNEQRKKKVGGKLSKECTFKLHQTIPMIWMVEPAWLKMYGLLQSYGNQHGSVRNLCNTTKTIPKKHKLLKEWVQSQRKFDSLVNIKSSVYEMENLDNFPSNTPPSLTLEQAEWLQEIPGWTWESASDSDESGNINNTAAAEDDDEFGTYFLQLKRLQVQQQYQASMVESIKKSSAKNKSSSSLKINVRKTGKLGKFVQLQRKLYQEQYPDGHDDFTNTDSVDAIPLQDQKPTIESLAAAAETVEAAAVTGTKRKEAPSMVDDVAAGDTNVNMEESTLHQDQATGQEPSTDSNIGAPVAKKAKTEDSTNDNDTLTAAVEAQIAEASTTTPNASQKKAASRKRKSIPPTMVLSRRKIQALDSIGFSWSPTNVQHSWEDMFEQLQHYKQEHGNCLVAKRYKRNPKLGMWVGKQRDRYKKFLQLQNSNDSNSKTPPQKKYWDNIKPLTKEELDLLNGIGFVWQAGGPEQLKIDWQGMFEKLKEHKEQHGTCNISQKAAGELGRLGRWVKTQREKYHGSKVNLTPLTPDQKAQLESIGFEFRPGGTKSRDETWTTMFNELKAFRDEHGDCKVPQKKGKLGGWVDRQRKRYRATEAAAAFLSKPENKGMKPPSLVHNTLMTDDQIESLNSIGFVWQLRDRASKGDDAAGSSDIREFNPMDPNDISMHDVHQGDPEYHHPGMQHNYLHPSQHHHPHHGHGLMLNAPEDEAATRSLLYFQGGGATAGNDSSNHPAPGGYGLPPSQYDYSMPHPAYMGGGHHHHSDNYGTNADAGNPGMHGDEQQHHHGNEAAPYPGHPPPNAAGYPPPNANVYDGSAAAAASYHQMEPSRNSRRDEMV